MERAPLLLSQRADAARAAVDEIETAARQYLARVEHALLTSRCNSYDEYLTLFAKTESARTHVSEIERVRRKHFPQ